jgi:predicted nucleic acid-binding protein
MWQGSPDCRTDLVDCLIAAVAIRTGTPLLHSDIDFDVLARHTDLQVYGRETL